MHVKAKRSGDVNQGAKVKARSWWRQGEVASKQKTELYQSKDLEYMLVCNSQLNVRAPLIQITV